MVHIPVLLRETMEMMKIEENGIYVDATVGLGGHSSEILARLSASGRVIGIDRDEDALMHASERLGNERVHLKKGSFSQLQDILSSLDIEWVDGVLFDLGVSMLQLKEYSRGFSFLSDARLDMRMDKSQKLTAWDVVNRYSEKEIERILKEFAEERLARKIARSLIQQRSKRHINTCAELAELVTRVYGGRGRIHPATKTFQALRIEVNKEIEELKRGLESAVGALKKGGRLCVISYHSLEDRIVKNFLMDKSGEGLLRVITKKPLTAGTEEVRRNPSARSAKLRGAERI